MGITFQCISVAIVFLFLPSKSFLGRYATTPVHENAQLPASKLSYSGLGF